MFNINQKLGITCALKKLIMKTEKANKQRNTTRSGINYTLTTTGSVIAFFAKYVYALDRFIGFGQQAETIRQRATKRAVCLSVCGLFFIGYQQFDK